MATPKRRQSKARKNKRRAHDALPLIGLSTCPNCHERKLPHRVVRLAVSTKVLSTSSRATADPLHSVAFPPVVPFGPEEPREQARFSVSGSGCSVARYGS